MLGPITEGVVVLDGTGRTEQRGAGAAHARAAEDGSDGRWRTPPDLGAHAGEIALDGLDAAAAAAHLDAGRGAGRAAAPAEAAAAGADAELDLEAAADCCYICMDEDDGTNQLGALLGRICACTTAAVHAGCLEKVLNSKKSRAKPLAERRKCTVCHTCYTVPLEAFVLSTGLLPLRVERFLRTRTGHLIARPLLIVLIVLHITIFAVLLRTGVTVFAAIGYLIAVSTPTLIFQILRDARRKRIEELSDIAFHERAVLHARREARMGIGGSSAAQVASAASASVILLVRARPAGEPAPEPAACQPPPPSTRSASLLCWRSRRAHHTGPWQRQSGFSLPSSIASACPDYNLHI